VKVNAARIPFWLLFTSVLWQPGPYALAVNPALDVSQYGHTAWRNREGFTTGEIDSLAQTPDGYLWLGSQSGLVQFDGVSTSRWQPPAGLLAPDKNTRSLLSARDGTLWVGTVGGLVSLKGSRVISYPQLDGANVTSLLEDGEGTIWVGASSPPSYDVGLLCAIRTGRTECYGTNGRFPTPVLALWEDRRGQLWVATVNGVWRWKPGPPKLYSLLGGKGPQALGESATGAIIVASVNKVQFILDGEIRELPLPQLPRAFRPNGVLCDQDGAIWISSLDAGLLHVHDGRTDWFTRADGLSGDVVRRLLEDREGSIWVATEAGLDRFHALATATYSTSQGVVGGTGSVLADTDGGVWFTTTGGLYRWQHGGIVVYRGEHRRLSELETTGRLIPEERLVAGLPDDPAGSLYRDRRGRLWVGTRSKLGYLETNRFISARGVPPGYIDSFAEDTEGNLWIVHRDAGLLQLTSDLEMVKQVPWKDLGVSGVARLAADPVRGGLWVGSISGGIAYFDHDQVRAFYSVREGLGKGRVNHIRVAADGTLWAATEGGLSRLKAGHVTRLDSTGGLPCDAVDWSIDDGNGSQWLYTECGLVRVAASELEAWAAAKQEGNAPHRRLRMMVFGAGDGVQGLAFAATSSYSPHLARAVDGKLWLAAPDGVTVVDPEHLPFNNLPPPVHVEHIVADRDAYNPTGRVALPPLIRDLEIDYTALSLVAPEKNQFRYKLEGYDRDWQSVGNRRQAFYNDLPPGNYSFRVMASNNSGVWNEQGAALDFSISPAYWQTTWFRAVCVAAFLALLWALYQLRLRQIRQAFNARLEERVDERTRIARDLHDTLLQSFQGLLLRFQTVRELLRTRPAEAEEMLGSAIDQTARAITEGREAVQGLRASTLERNDLVQAIRSIGEELAAQTSGDTPVGLRVDVEGVSRTLHPIVRDEIYRIASEALRNAFRHGEAKQIEAELRYDERQLRLRVRDDGKGIDPNFLRAEGRGGHFGLHGMHERAKLIGGKLTVWSAPDSGTEIELSIPAARAYAESLKSRRRWFGEKLTEKSAQSKS
jgi:signal transduction histidine kinase/ligand-binding sensor domain-containing protein